MIINKILGNIHQDQHWQNYQPEHLELDWYELAKRILRKTTSAQRELGINLPSDHPPLKDGDVLTTIDNSAIVILLKSCSCLSIKPKDQLELAQVCYEIGNRHAALFIDEANPMLLLLAYDAPLHEHLKKLNVATEIIDARLVQPLTGAKLGTTISISTKQAV